MESVIHQIVETHIQQYCLKLSEKYKNLTYQEIYDLWIEENYDDIVENITKIEEK